MEVTQECFPKSEGDSISECLVSDCLDSCETAKLESSLSSIELLMLGIGGGEVEMKGRQLSENEDWADTKKEIQKAHASMRQLTDRVLNDSEVGSEFVEYRFTNC